MALSLTYSLSQWVTHLLIDYNYYKDYNRSLIHKANGPQRLHTKTTLTTMLTMLTMTTIATMTRMTKEKAI